MLLAAQTDKEDNKHAFQVHQGLKRLQIWKLIQDKTTLLALTTWKLCKI